MKRIFLGIIFAIIAVLLCVLVVINSPQLTAAFVRAAVVNSFDDVELKEISIARQNYFFPHSLRVENIRADVVYHIDDDAKPISMSCRKLTMKYVFPVSISIKLSDMSVKSKEWFLNNLDFDGVIVFEGLKPVIRGSAQTDNVTLNSFMISGVTSTIFNDDEQIHIQDIDGTLYEGRLNGTIHLTTAPEMEYTIDFIVEEMNLDVLKKSHSAVFSDFSGFVNGQCQIEGTSDMIQHIQADISLVKGAEIRAVLFQYFVQYVPSSREKDTLNALIKQGLMLPVEVATLTLKGDRMSSIVGAIKIESDMLNLQLSLPFDITFDGSLNSFLKYLPKLVG